MSRASRMPRPNRRIGYNGPRQKGEEETSMRPTASARSALLAALATALATNLLLAATFGAQEAHACSCTSAPLEKRLQNAEAVFTDVAVDVGEMETG